MTLQIGDLGCQVNFGNNPNISISTGVLNAGQPTTISVTVQNKSGERVRLNAVQVTVCAANTTHGFMKESILPSLRGINGLEFDNVFPFPSDVVLDPGGSTTIALPTWTPQLSDIHSFDNVAGAMFEDFQKKTVLHVCIFANCVGSFPPVNTGPVTDDGRIVTWSNEVGTNFCSDLHHAQHNVSLHRLANQRSLTMPFYAGIEAGEGMVSAKIFVKEFTQSAGIDPLILDKLNRAGFGSLPLQPAVEPAKSIGVARFRGGIQRVEDAVEEVVDEVKEGIEHLLGHTAFEDDEGEDGTPKALIRVRLKPQKLLPLLLKAEFDAAEPVGSVHIFDVTQENADGTLGGFRLATVNAP